MMKTCSTRYQKANTHKCLRSFLLSVLVAAIAACGAQTSYDALPKATKPVPKEFLTYFLAYGNSGARYPTRANRGADRRNLPKGAI